MRYICLLLLILTLPGLAMAQTGTSADAHYANGLPLVGRLIFPFGFPLTYLDIQLEDEQSGRVIATATSGPRGEFNFKGVAVEKSYNFLISAQGLDYVRQPLVVDKQNFETIRVVIQLRRFQEKSLFDIEDVVSVKSLTTRNIPRAAISSVENGLDERRKGNTIKAAAELEKALRLAPDYYEANLQLGIFYHTQARRDDARRLLLRALELNSASRKARAVLGLIYFETGEFQKSADLMSAAARLGNMSPDLYYALGVSYLRLGELALAEETLQRTIVMSDGAMGESHIQLYNVYLKLKQPGRALEQLELFLLKFPKSPDRADVETKALRLRKALNPGPRI